MKREPKVIRRAHFSTNVGSHVVTVSEGEINLSGLSLSVSDALDLIKALRVAMNVAAMFETDELPF